MLFLDGCVGWGISINMAYVIKIKLQQTNAPTNLIKDAK